MKVIGWDIGGANIKATCLVIEKGKITWRTVCKYFPLWLKGREQLIEGLKTVVAELSGEKADFFGVSMTAELSDIYPTKSEGVRHVLSSISKLIDREKILVMGVNGKFVRFKEAYSDPLLVAAANWPATARMVGKRFPNSLLIDVGSTTTDIIPVKDGWPKTCGKTDTERLQSGELVYTGALRTPISAIVRRVPLRGGFCRVSSERFALSADVHMILGHISEREYTTETADGRGKSLEESYARLARIVCSDLDLISTNDLVNMAKYIYFKQLEEIREAITQVLGHNRFIDVERTPVVVTGVGRKFLAVPAVKSLGFKKIVEFEREFGEEVAATSYSVAALLAEELAYHEQTG